MSTRLKSQRPVLLATSLLACLLLTSPAALADREAGPRDSSPVLRGQAQAIAPAPGSEGVRPGTQVVFDLSNISSLKPETIKQLSKGHFRALVFESRPGVSASMSILEPGNSCDYDRAANRIRVNIPDMKPHSQYFVLITTGLSYKPRLWPIDENAQRAVFSVREGRVLFFGDHGGQGIPVPHAPGSLSAGDRVVFVRHPDGQLTSRRLAVYRLSTVFSTGPAPNEPVKIDIRCPDVVPPDAPVKVVVAALDSYNELANCSIEFQIISPGNGAIRNPGCEAAQASVQGLIAKPGYLECIVHARADRAVELIATALYGEKKVTARKTILFEHREIER